MTNRGFMDLGLGGKAAIAIALLAVVGQSAQPAIAAETIFLQDGRTIQADKVEIIGDRVRIEKPAETIDLPRSEVLSIHPSTAPSASPPSEVYRGMTDQMNDKVRREIEGRPGGSGPR
jgi:hypothetical protein